MTESITLSDAIKEAYEFAPPDVTYYDTIELSHVSLIESIKLVYSDTYFVAKVGRFEPCKFDFVLPETEGKVRGEMQVSVNFIPKSIQMSLLNAAQTRMPVTMRYRQYAAENSDPEAEYPTALTISNIDQTPAGVTLTALFPDLQNAVFPRKLMTTSVLPGGIV